MENYNIGDIVASKQHPYFKSNQKSIISGEHLMIPPLMVIVEMLLVLRDEHSEEDGEKLSEKGNANCKCIWFSSKTYQFEEVWIHSNQLKFISKGVVISDKTAGLVGSNAYLSTLELELGKQKSSIVTEHSSNEPRDKKSINSLLSFVPPVMQVLQIKKTDQKEIKFDVKTGNQKRFYPKFEVKCKWFNPNGEKFSEKFLPLESLKILEILSDAKIAEITNVILNGYVIKIDNSLFKPNNIYFRSGFYSISGFDFIQNLTIEIPFSNDFEIVIVKNLYIKSAPDFKLISSHGGKEWYNKDSINHILNDSILNKFFTCIKYQNREEKITTRTVSKLVLHTTLEVLETGEEPKEIVYLEAYCHLRKDVRYFRVDRIISLKQLNINY